MLLGGGGGGGGGEIHNNSYIWSKWAHGLYRPQYTLREINFMNSLQ
jgi:hypothetical protein